jgi:S1-C subfamily serine protease
MKKLFIILFSLLFCSCCHLGENIPKPTTSHTIYESVGKLVVFADIGNIERKIGSGTGFAIRDNYLLTAEHVCDAEDGIPGLPNVKNIKIKMQYRTKIDLLWAEHSLIPVIRDKKRDLCILFLQDNPLKPIPFSRNWPKAGDKIYTYGHPSGLMGVLTEGYYSQPAFVQYSKDGPKIYSAALSVPAWFGNSGGPVLDSDGKFIGVLIAGENYHHITYTPAYLEMRDFLKGFLFK